MPDHLVHTKREKHDGLDLNGIMQSFLYIISIDTEPITKVYLV